MTKQPIHPVPLRGKNARMTWKSLFGMALLASLLGGCSPQPRLACPDPAVAMVAPGPGEGRVSVNLQNNTCMSVCVLLVTPDHCEYMGGVDWLGDHPLPSGESITLDILPGKYTAWMEYCTEEYVALEHLKVDSDTAWTLSDSSNENAPPCGTSLTVVNNSTVPICSMWIGNTESVYTGWNWIGAEHILVGESRTIVLKPDTYFVRAEACDGTWLRAEVDVPVSGQQIWTVP